MVFCREPIAEHLSTETRAESFNIHADYPWGAKTALGNPEQHIEIPYADLPALVKELVQIMHENCDGVTTTASEKAEIARDEIFEEINTERDRQGATWTPQHDDTHTLHEWNSIVMGLLGKAANESTYATNAYALNAKYTARDYERNWRKEMMRLAAVCVAAIESYDRTHETPAAK